MAATWRVTNQRMFADLTPDGRFENFWEVSFEIIATGQTAQVTLAERQYTPENVAAKISTVAATMTSVAGLEG